MRCVEQPKQRAGTISCSLLGVLPIGAEGAEAPAGWLGFPNETGGQMNDLRAFLWVLVIVGPILLVVYYLSVLIGMELAK